MKKSKDYADLGTKETQARSVEESRADPDGNIVRGMRVMNQTPLDVYCNRGTITKTQKEAGEKLYFQWYRAGRQPVLCFSYLQKTSRGNNDSYAEAKEDARQAYMEALREAGENASVLVAVCLLGEWAKDWAVAKMINPRKGIKYLRRALDGLAEFYGLTKW